MRRAIIATTLALVLSLAPGPPAVATAPVPRLTLLLANIWSFGVQSRRLLADLGYAVEYVFEFGDEEELRLRSTAQSEVVEGTLRTILDGDPVDAVIRIQGEQLPLVIRRDRDLLVAAWDTGGRLLAADLPRAEIDRRWNLMLSLLAETKRRLGLAAFSPSQDLTVQLSVAGLDTLVLKPAKDTPEYYEIRNPATPAATEYLVTEVGERRWEITWGRSQLAVRLTPPLDPRTVLTSLTYQGGRIAFAPHTPTLPEAEARRVVGKAFSVLGDARRYFGTTAITPALPRRSR